MDVWMAAGAFVCDLFGDADVYAALRGGGDAGGGGGEGLVVGKRIDGDERVQLTEIGRLLKAGLVFCDEPAEVPDYTSSFRSRRNGFDLSERLTDKGSKPFGDNDFIVMSMVGPIFPACTGEENTRHHKRTRG